MTDQNSQDASPATGSLRTAAALAVRALGRDAGARSAMRRALGREVADVPQSWRHLPDHLGPDSHRVLLATMSLYSLAYQAGTIDPHQAQVGLGQAYAKLERSGKLSASSAEAQFVRLLRSAGLNQSTDRLRRLTPLLSRANAGLDYGVLAGNLYALAYGDVSEQQAVRAAWVRQRGGMTT